MAQETVLRTLTIKNRINLVDISESKTFDYHTLASNYSNLLSFDTERLAIE